MFKNGIRHPGFGSYECGILQPRAKCRTTLSHAYFNLNYANMLTVLCIGVALDGLVTCLFAKCPNWNSMYPSPLNRRSFFAVTGGALAAAATKSVRTEKLTIRAGLVVGHPEGSEAGNAVLSSGGNAVDAIVAASLVAGVVAVTRCGIGGYGGHMAIGLPDGKVKCIDFNSEAAQATRADMFSVDATGRVKDGANTHGWRAAGVPATMAGLQFALDHYGTRSLANIIEPAIRYARDGFDVYWPWAGAASNLARDPGSAKLFAPNGKLLQKGDKYRNPDLARLLEKLATSGSAEDFYHGETARHIAEAFKKNGGLVTANDLANYRPLETDPLSITWNGHTIATAPLTAGGLTILQTIAALKALGPDWAKIPQDSPRRTHGWIEALRLSWGDRLRLFGDERFTHVPVEQLLSDSYAQTSAEQIRSAVRQKRYIPISTDGRAANGTVHLSAVDQNGMLASLTLTHGDSFGAQITVDGLGLILGHGMSRFDPVPGRANSIAPGKRPLDNMSPTIVLRDDKPVLAIGAAGGRRIPNGIFEVLLNKIGDGENLADAITKPRLHTDGSPKINAERGRPAAEIDYLKQAGYSILGGQQCYVAAVELDHTRGANSIVGVADTPPGNSPGVRNPDPLVVKVEAS